MISAQQKFHISMAPQVPVVVARYGGEAALMGKVVAAVQAHQSDADALLAAHLFAAILDRLALYGGTLQVGALGLGRFLPLASSSARHVMHYLLACFPQPLAMLAHDRICPQGRAVISEFRAMQAWPKNVASHRHASAGTYMQSTCVTGQYTGCEEAVPVGSHGVGWAGRDWLAGQGSGLDWGSPREGQYECCGWCKEAWHRPWG